jgi:hypothetical protein
VSLRLLHLVLLWLLHHLVMHRHEHSVVVEVLGARRHHLRISLRYVIALRNHIIGTL